MPQHSLPAAGLPWFMALFGGESLITRYEMLAFAPEVAVTILVGTGDARARWEYEPSTSDRYARDTRSLSCHSGSCQGLLGRATRAVQRS